MFAKLWKTDGTEFKDALQQNLSPLGSQVHSKQQTGTNHFSSTGDEKKPYQHHTFLRSETMDSVKPMLVYSWLDTIERRNLDQRRRSNLKLLEIQSDAILSELSGVSGTVGK